MLATFLSIASFAMAATSLGISIALIFSSNASIPVNEVKLTPAPPDTPIIQVIHKNSHWDRMKRRVVHPSEK